MKSNTRTFLSLISFLSLLAIGCSQQPRIETKYSNAQVEGIDSLTLRSIHEDIQNGDYGLIDHFLVIRNNRLVYDREYQHDYDTIAQQYDTTRHQYNYDHPHWHPYYNASPLHSLQSVSKSITSILVGIAMDEGLMIPLDSSIFDLFYDYSLDGTDERKKAITLRNLLTMQGGLRWDENSSYADNQENNCTVMELSDDWIQYVLDRPMDTLPGTRFEYNSGITVLLGKILQITTGQRIDKWAEEKLFEPLGITEYYWKKTPKGEIDTEGGLYLTAYDLSKIGQLMLHKGAWNDKQIVSEKWVEESIQPHVQFNERSGYGFQWWVPEGTDRQTNIFAARGYGGQYIIVNRDKNMVVVFTGWNIHEPPEKSAYSVMSDRIIPNMLN